MPRARTREPRVAVITTTLRNRILEGQWKPAQMIGSENDLANEFGVCRATITKTLKELEREGLLWSRRGKGRFVADLTQRPKTWAIGLVLANMDRLTHPVLDGHLAGIRDVLGKTDYHLKIYAINATSQAPLARNHGPRLWSGLINPMSIDGVIVMTRELPQNRVMELSTYLPVVWMERQTLSPRISGVRHDFTAAAFDAVRHLVELGHRRIGLITIGESFVQGRDQRAGARLGMRDVLAGNAGELIIESVERNRKPEGYEATRRLLTAPDRPTAILCGSDDLALGAFDAIRQQGLVIPRDISVVGWNDVLTPEEAPVPMTSVRTDHYQVGAACTQRLLWMMQHPDQMQETLELPAQLMIRQSTAPPPGR